MQIHLNIGHTNWVYKDKLAFVFTTARSDHYSYQIWRGSLNRELRECQILLGVFH